MLSNWHPPSCLTVRSQAERWVLSRAQQQERLCGNLDTAGNLAAEVRPLGCNVILQCKWEQWNRASEGNIRYYKNIRSLNSLGKGPRAWKQIFFTGMESLKRSFFSQQKNTQIEEGEGFSEGTTLLDFCRVALGADRSPVPRPQQAQSVKSFAPKRRYN